MSYKPMFNTVLSRDYFPRIKEGTYMVNLNDKKSKGNDLNSLFIDKNMTMYFGLFGIFLRGVLLLNCFNEMMNLFCVDFFV